MLNISFLRFIIIDILSIGSYTLSEIAKNTQVPEEIIYEIASGYNIDPPFKAANNIIKFHRELKPDFYRQVVKNVMNRMKKKI